MQQIGAAGSPLRLTTDPASEHNPVWSPDGRWIAFLRGEPARPLAQSHRELWLMAPLGGSERKLGDVRVQEMSANPIYLAWCPDSRCVIVSDTTGTGKPDALFAVALDAGDKRQLTFPQPPVISDSNPAVTRDGRSLLFLRRSTWAVAELYVMPLRSDMTPAGDPRRVPAGKLNPEHAIWLPDGDEILFSTPMIAGSANLWRIPAAGSETPSRLPFVGEDGVMPVVSPASAGRPARLVYVHSRMDDNIWRLDTTAPGTPATAPPSLAIASTRAEIHPQLSPDGSRVAFTSTRSGSWEIWTSAVDGSNAVQVTTLRTSTGTGVPRWSPDGNTIVFASDVEGQFELFAVSASGGKPRNMTSHPALDHVPAFSRDGRWIYFSSRRSGTFQIWRMPAAGGEPLQVTTEGGWISQESVDGAYLYYTPTPAVGASMPLWRKPTAGGAAERVVDGVLNHSFAVIASGIYYIDRPANEGRLRFLDFAAGAAVTIAPALGGALPYGGFSVSADGRTILYARLDSSVDDLVLVENFR